MPTINTVTPNLVRDGHQVSRLSTCPGCGRIRHMIDWQSLDPRRIHTEAVNSSVPGRILPRLSTADHQ